MKFKDQQFRRIEIVIYGMNIGANQFEPAPIIVPIYVGDYILNEAINLSKSTLFSWKNSRSE